MFQQLKCAGPDPALATERHTITPFESFVSDAKEKSELWRTALGALLIAGILILLILLMSQVGNLAVFKHLDLLFYLGLVSLHIPAIAITVKSLHGRSFWTLFGKDGFLIRNFFLGIAAGAVYLLVAITISLPFAPEFKGGVVWSSWFLFLLPAIGLIFLQSASEELFFRGYLQQQLGAKLSPSTAMILPSIVFSLMHYSDVWGRNLLIYLFLIFAFGVVLADVTRRTGNLSFAIGLHFANNLYLLLVVGDIDPEFQQSLSLWVDPTPLDNTITGRLLVISFFAVAITYSALLWRAKKLE